MKRLAMIAAFAACFAMLPGSADAIYRSSSLDIGGHIRSTNIVRHPRIDRMSFIMQRNTLKLRLEYKWLQRGKAFGKYEVPFLKRSDVFMLYRGVYDSVYDFTPGMIEREDIRGKPLLPSQTDLDFLSERERDSAGKENRLREYYMDFYFKKLPLTLRIGRQQIVWGESDGFRMLDRINPLDTTWHFIQELPPPGFGFDELREPMFMVKGLWDFKKIGPLSQTFLEAFWNPGWDWSPAKIAFQPHPWGVNLPHPLTDPQTGAFKSTFCLGSTGKNCTGLMNGTELFHRGNFARNVRDNSQFGVRFHWLAPGGSEWTLNYLYQRFSPDGSPVALVRGVPRRFDDNGNEMAYIDVPTNNPASPTRKVTPRQFCEGLREDPTIAGRFIPWAANELCVEYYAPYVHTVGMSMNFFEGEWTQTVWRLETVVDFNLPFADPDKRVGLLGRDADNNGFVPGITERSMWKGMIAFDRPTWFRSLNKKSTFFLSGQFFWHHIMGNKHRRCAIQNDPANGYSKDPTFEACGGGPNNDFLLPGEQSGFIGPLDLPNLDNPAGAFRDKVNDWEFLATFAAIGFYRGGTVVPALIYIIDPKNHAPQEVALGVDWFYTPDFAINFTTRLMWMGVPWDTYAGVERKDMFDPWFLGAGNRGRSESSIQITYQF